MSHILTEQIDLKPMDNNKLQSLFYLANQLSLSTGIHTVATIANLFLLHPAWSHGNPDIRDHGARCHPPPPPPLTYSTYSGTWLTNYHALGSAPRLLVDFPRILKFTKSEALVAQVSQPIKTRVVSQRRHEHHREIPTWNLPLWAFHSC